MLRLQSEIEYDFEEILVDEYQDTNPLQGRILDGFKSKSMFCVGDYDQSIYAFNGADINIISSFDERYIDAKVFTLKKNYRSTSAILNLASTVINNNPRIYEKELEVVRNEKPIAPKLLGFPELFDQYEYIAKNISNTIQNQEIGYDDIAIIFRNNSTADGIEANLREFNIPSRRKGGTSFFDSREIKALLDLMTILHNPKDMMAFIHIFEYAKGVGNAIAKELFDGLIRLSGDKQNIIDGFFHPVDIASPFEKPTHNVQLGLFDDCIEFGSITRFRRLNFEDKFLANDILKHPKLHIDGADYLHDLYGLIKQTRQIKNPSRLLQTIISSKIFIKITELLSTKRGTLKDGSVDMTLKEESKDRISNKAKILQNLTYHYHDIHKFLNAMILGGGELSQGEGVNLLTIHASKGLEFKKVFIIDLMEGRFPNKKLMNSGGSLDEERRLFYVAVTRARDELILSYAKYDKIKKLDFIASQFLREAKMIE
jgi:DNA helicase-2/ATP-dependent DNA helicase PcrA